MNQFISKHLRLVTALCLLLLMGGIGWFGVVPFYGHIRETRDEIQKFYASREYRNTQFSRLPDIRTQFEAVRQDEGHLDILLTQERIVDFVKKLESLAEETGVDISIKSEDKPLPEGKKVIVTTEEGEKPQQAKKTLVESLPSNKYLYLKLTLAGDYASLLSFLHKMETAPYALDVVAIDVHPKNNDDASSNTEATSGRKNPFSLSPSQGTVTETEETEGEIPATNTNSLKPLEAFIDVAVYVDKLENPK